MRKGWFEIPGVQSGFRTQGEQLEGLFDLANVVRGRRVLDLGCAEGLIAKHLLAQGATYVLGIDCFGQAIKEARAQCIGLPAHFIRADLNIARPWIDEQFDVVLMLAILHKLKDPPALVNEVLRMDPELIVVRLPPHCPGYVRDERSGFQIHDVAKQIVDSGYTMTEGSGPRDEWIGFFRRRP